MERKRHSSLQVEVGLGIVMLIAGAVLGAVAENFITNEVLPSFTWVLVVLLVCLVGIGLMVHYSIIHIGELRNKVGVSIMYIARDKNGQAHIYQAIKRVTDQAQHSVLVLNSAVVSSGDSQDDSATLKARVSLHDSLVEAAIKRHLTYERVIQVRNPEAFSSMLTDRAYIRHFHRILDEREKNENFTVNLLKVPAQGLTTFTLVDDKWLIWQVPELLSSGDMRAQGSFLIHDPGETITKQFREMFENVKRNSLGSVQRSDLPPLDQSPARTEAQP